ncbi:hypothetical protein HN51_064268 [Arachis hypogaea]
MCLSDTAGTMYTIWFTLVIRVLTPVFAVNIPPNPLRWRLFWILLFTAMTYVMQLCLQALRSLLGWAYRNMPPGMLTGGGSTIFMQIRSWYFAMKASMHVPADHLRDDHRQMI